jgi:hypothetical protein
MDRVILKQKKATPFPKESVFRASTVSKPKRVAYNYEKFFTVLVYFFSGFQFVNKGKQQR